MEIDEIKKSGIPPDCVTTDINSGNDMFVASTFQHHQPPSSPPPPPFEETDGVTCADKPKEAENFWSGVPAAAMTTSSAHHQSSVHPAGGFVPVIIARQHAATKTIGGAYIYWFPLGLFGFHHFYLRRHAFGLLYLFTAGLFGIGWLVDAFRIPFLVASANRRIQQRPGDANKNDDYDAGDKVSLGDAYVLWFPLGILGLHHYYMGRTPWGVLYTFTAALCGLGWLVDMFRMPCLVAEVNKCSPVDDCKKKVADAYVYGATPAGLFGAHHFYLGRTTFGVYYLITLGGFGLGWIVDWVRMPWLVKRVNEIDQHPLGSRHKYLDDAYLMAFPAGFLGLHHFYLERPTWGMVYLFTLGLFGVGWLIDLFRMPCLVDETNKRLATEAAIFYEVRQQMGMTVNSVIVTYSADCQQQQQHLQPSMMGVNSSSVPASAAFVEGPTTGSMEPSMLPRPPPYSCINAPTTAVQNENKMPPVYTPY